MLIALGDTYNNIENSNEAKKVKAVHSFYHLILCVTIDLLQDSSIIYIIKYFQCYYRAVRLGDSEGQATVKLGK